MSTLKFSPHEGSYDKRWIMQGHRLGVHQPLASFINRRTWNFTLPNRNFLVRANAYLHHYACHAPKAVQSKYKHAYKKFDKQHFGTSVASRRYLNEYSCHAWM